MDRKPLLETLRELPLPALFLLMAGLWIVLQLIVHSGGITVVTVVSTTVGGLLFSAVMTSLVAAARRRLGGPQRVTAFAAALRTGRAPAGADTSRWRQELDRLDRTRPRRTALLICISLLPIALGVWALTDADARPLGLLLLLLLTGLDAAVLLSVPGQRRRVQRLRQHLGATAEV